eukprot:g7839.t1
MKDVTDVVAEASAQFRPIVIYSWYRFDFPASFTDPGGHAEATQVRLRNSNIKCVYVTVQRNDIIIDIQTIQNYETTLFQTDYHWTLKLEPTSSPYFER